MVGEGNCDPELHLHSFGELSKFFFLRKMKSLEILAVQRRIPVVERILHNQPDLCRSQAFWKTDFVHNNANLFFWDRSFGRAVFPKNPYGTGIFPDNIQNQLDCGRLSGTIFPDQSKDTAAWKCKIQMIQ